jgi:prevent-host-death family protein
MREVTATEFKAKCLKLLDEVDAEGIVITKHGKAVAKLVPLDDDLRSLYGKYKGRITIHGDIVSSGRDWRVES